MYFVARYNWINDQLTDKCPVGFFRSLKRAKKYVDSTMTNDKRRNTIEIVRINEGFQTYNFPTAVYEWSEYYQIYIPVLETDMRRKMVITY